MTKLVTIALSLTLIGCLSLPVLAAEAGVPAASASQGANSDITYPGQPAPSMPGAQTQLNGNAIPCQPMVSSNGSTDANRSTHWHRGYRSQSRAYMHRGNGHRSWRRGCQG